MRVAIFTAPGQVEIRQLPVPSASADMVVIGVQICGVCGSDLAYWKGKGQLDYPYSAGHEFCGCISQIGDGVEGLSPGQRVVVDPNLSCGACRNCLLGRPNLCERLKSRPIKSNGGFSDFVCLHHRMVHPLSDRISAQSATFIEPLSCVLHAIKIAGTVNRLDVAVFGLGTVGILAARLLQEQGCRLTLIEPSPERRRVAKNCLSEPGGVVDFLTPQEADAQALTETVDTVLECSGNIGAVCQAIKMLRKSGRLVLAGLSAGVSKKPVPFDLVTKKELEIKGTWLNPNTFGQALDWSLRNADFLDRLQTRTFALADIRSALQHAMQPGVVKVLVRP